MIKVANMTSTNGNKIANQFIIEDGDKRIFQSYDSTIASIEYAPQSREVLIDPNYFDYSRTTMKYLKEFLGHGIVETRARLSREEYKFKNLNY
jgi:hypothetical protein